eukprot:TRINITY_DN37665_c0_g1_i1.p1 TRINITY_DN37665_c0_g1~~TRINITY_DN37665_c0_g1_i1.p1  ORF type:complete len:318 (+),score=118.83 TRINITY_DN37665_c0_g1_i1:42-995(+)
MRRAVRSLGKQARWSHTTAAGGENSALKMFAVGTIFGGGLFALSSGSVNDVSKDKQVNDQRNKIAALEKKLKEQEKDASKMAELRLLSDDFLQCTKGSEQLTGEMENMASRLKATQNELLTARQKMDDLTKDNESYINSLQDRINAKIQTGKASATSFVTDKGDLVTFRRTDKGEIDVTVGGKPAGTLSKNIEYDEAAGAVNVNSAKIVFPENRREILVGQLATLADNTGLAHNLVGNFVEFTDADGDRVKFNGESGKLVVEMKGGLVALTGDLTYNKDTKTLACGGAGSCTLPAEDQAILLRLRRLAQKTSHPNSL